MSSPPGGLVEAVRTVDVAVLGGGLAGNLIARQLRRQVPGLSVALFEKSTEGSFKVGESSVEIAGNYLTRRLGLTSYLYQHQLPKNGLRFFFDTPEKNAELYDMTELGSRHLLRLPSFQLDRARLEDDLLRMNRDAGVEVHLGAKAHDLALSPSSEAGPGQHEFTVTEGEQQTRWRCKWLIDASGRASLVARDQDLRVPTDLPVSAVWGRFRGYADMDDMGPPEWRGRVQNTARFLSTNHFCYPGYWIWFIPLGQEVMSVGWVGEKAQFRDAWRKPEGFLEFLKGHKAVWDLLRGGEAELVDILSYKQLAYGTKRFFRGEDRWFLLGEAAAFTDPFYSPGSDFISIESDYIVDLIARDAAGESLADIRERSDAYDEFMQFRFAATVLLYRDLYSVLGSYELLKLKWDFDIACYYNLWAAPFFTDQHLDLRYLKSELRRKEFVLQGLENFARFFKQIEGEMHARGGYYRKNLGQYCYQLDLVDFMDDMFAPRPRRQVMRTTEAIFNGTRDRGLAILQELGVVPTREAPALPLYEFMLQEPLA
nr:tryptophan 7-halogenase [Nannocystis sp. ILAH1]